MNLPQSVTFDPSATLPQLFEAGHSDVGALFALVAILATACVLGRTLFGYRLRVTGEARRAARLAASTQNAQPCGLCDLGQPLPALPA